MSVESAAKRPPVRAQVADGVWSLPLPYPSPLDHSYCYLVEGDDGLVVVDTGYDIDEGWATLLDGLAEIGASLDDVEAVAITHIHPDHYGLAGRIREAIDVWIGMHPAEAARIPASEEDLQKILDEIASWLQAAGAPSEELDALREDTPRLRKQWSFVAPDGTLLDGEPVPGAKSMYAVHTPGHTPGHLCFADTSREIVFTGDHLLPRITPNVTMRPRSGKDPLGAFVQSLDRMTQFDGFLALPGHEWPFRHLHDRIDELRRHHAARMAEVASAVHSDGSTAWEVAQSVTWSRPWSSMSSATRRSALGETTAHLVRLASEHRVRRVDGPATRWSPVEG